MGGREQAEEDRGDEEGEEEEGIKVMTCSGASQDLVMSENPRQERRKTLYRSVWTVTMSAVCSTPQGGEEEEEEEGLPHPRVASVPAGRARLAITIRDPSETEG